jgi:hypothetical protein
MNSSLINKILIISKIIFPAILCVLLTPIFTNTNWEYLALLVFGISIVLFNYNKTKNNFMLSFLIAIILSYTVYFLSILISGVIKFILMGGDLDKKIEGFILGIDINALFILIPISIISPLLMFYCYRIIFNINKTNYFTLVKRISLIILIFIGFISDFFEDGNLYIYWQVIMALALQLILYSKEIKDLFSLKKNIL